MNSSQCYKLLGLDEGASINQIKDAYRRLALEYHPDKNISAKDGEKFKMISEAYHTLREKNNSYGRIDHSANSSTKNYQHSEYDFLAWLNLFYSKMHYIYKKYVKNTYQNYLKYGPVFLKYYDKTERSASILIHDLIRSFPYYHIKVIFLNYIKMTKKVLVRI